MLFYVTEVTCDIKIKSLGVAVSVPKDTQVLLPASFGFHYGTRRAYVVNDEEHPVSVFSFVVEGQFHIINQVNRQDRQGLTASAVLSIHRQHFLPARFLSYVSPARNKDL